MQLTRVSFRLQSSGQAVLRLLEFADMISPGEQVCALCVCVRVCVCIRLGENGDGMGKGWESTR